MAAAVAVIIANGEGCTVQWEYDDVSLVVSGLRIINPTGGKPFNLTIQVTGSTTRTVTRQAGTNALVILPAMPTLTKGTNNRGGTVLIFSVDFHGGCVNGGWG